MTPQHAKRLLMALADNVEKYEQNFGPIRVDEVGPNMAPFPFSGPAGMA
jgi:hypothetical protein